MARDAEPPETADERLLRPEYAAVRVQAVEVKRRHGQSLTQTVDVKLASEAPHSRLERLRSSVLPERQDLTVLNCLTERLLPRRLDDLGQGGGDVVEAPREDAHLIASLVHLDARTVHLVL